MSFSRLARSFFQRNFSSSSKALAEHHGPSASAGHDGVKTWQNLSYFVALPAVAVCMINAYVKEKEHLAHYHRPEFVPYEHMRIRTKKFPWGDGNHSLFHNPKMNPLPDGYEDIEEDHH